MARGRGKCPCLRISERCGFEHLYLTLSQCGLSPGAAGGGGMSPGESPAINIFLEKAAPQSSYPTQFIP